MPRGPSTTPSGALPMWSLEGVLKLLLPPYLCNSLRVSWEILLKLLPNADGVDQRTIHIKSQCLCIWHGMLLVLRSQTPSDPFRHFLNSVRDSVRACLP